MHRALPGGFGVPRLDVMTQGNDSIPPTVGEVSPSPLLRGGGVRIMDGQSR